MLGILQGEGVIELLSDVAIDDGQWHQVRAQFNPSRYMEVTVDGVKKSLRPPDGSGGGRADRNIDLSGLLYFGGVHASKLGQANAQGIKVLGQIHFIQAQIGLISWDICHRLSQ